MLKSKLQTIKNIRKAYLFGLAALIGGANLAILLPSAYAAGTYLSNVSVAETNMDVSGNSEVAISFKTSSSNTGTSLSVTFTGWTGSTAGIVNTTQTVTNGCAAFPGLSGANLPGTPTASGSSATVTFSGLTAMTASTQYCVTLSSTSAVTNPSTAGQYGVSVTAGTDSATTAEIDVLTSDQYTVNATVPPSFTMTSPTSPDNFSANLSSSGVTTTGGTSVTVTTNAKNGWYVWAEDSNAGLASASNGYTIPSVPTGANESFSSGTYGPGVAAYGLGVTSVTSSGSATTNYADAGGTTGGGLSNAALNEIADGTSSTNGSTVNIKELANIAGTTPAGADYTDVITLVGSGSF